MTKNLITIREFIDQSIGEWRSIRSTHTIAFQEFENTTSNISISYLNVDNTKVEQTLKKFNISKTPAFAIEISWVAVSDWELEDKVNTNETVLIFIPKDNKSGIILRNKGYAELVHSSSEYFMDNRENLNIITKYNSTISEERIWFLTKNIRSRYSMIQSKHHNAIMQTSHSSEIRQIFI